MVNTAASRRLTKEYINIQKSPPAFLFARPLENNILEWYERKGPSASQWNLPDMNDITFYLSPKRNCSQPFFFLSSATCHIIRTAFFCVMPIGITFSKVLPRLLTTEANIMVMFIAVMSR